VFERPDGVPVPDPEAFLDVPFKDNHRIGILLGTTYWTLVGRLKPREDTCCVKCVRARKSFGRLGVETRDGFEADGTRLIVMDTTFTVYKSWSFTLSTVDRH
jgi:hypothetical protein